MSYLFGFVVLLGVLIFIHELGHFLLAKACGVRVETFSIGMGHKILKFVRGETEYALSLIPLGGYVKLTGQDPREEVPKELESRSFRHKTLLQRTAIVLAGPIFNAALTVLIFCFLYFMGAPSVAPVVERVLAGTQASEAGLKSGDWVKEIKTNSGETFEIREYSDLERTLNNFVNQELYMTVERELPWSQETQKIEVKARPQLGMTRDSTLGVIREKGIILGLERQARAPLLHILPQSWAEQRQVPEALWVESIEIQTGSLSQTHTVRTFEELEKIWAHYAERAQNASEGYFELKGQVAKVSADDAEKTSSPTGTYTLAWTRLQDRVPTSLELAGIKASELVVLEVIENTPAAQLGLQKGDEILSLNGEPVKSFMWFRESLQKLAHSNTEILISWRRGTEVMNASVVPERVSTTDPYTEAKKDQFQIGAAFMALPAMPKMYPLKAHNLVDAISLGWTKTIDLTQAMLASFYYLAKGEISPKTMGGPILIGKIAGDSVKQGWEAFLKMMAFISLNLFILNLLPIPVLDGGHLVLFAIEAIRRKPLSLKVIEIWSTAGFFLIMGLIAFVFFNDLSRLGVFKIFGS